MRLLTPGENSFRFVLTVTLAEIFGGCIAYWLVIAWDGVKPLLFAIGWGAGWGAIMGLILILQARLYSLDDLERERLRGENYEAQMEYLAAKEAHDAGVTRIPYAVEVSNNSTIYGALSDSDLAYIRKRYQEGYTRPSERNYPRLNKHAWGELERLQFVYYPGAKGAGRQWTETGRKVIGLKNG